MPGWRLVFDHVDHASRRDRIILGLGLVPRTCRFCRRRGPGATFRKRAHVIPEGLGNRTLISREECDDCNLAAGQGIEQCLINSLAAARPLSRLRSGRGGVKYKPPGQGSVLRSAPERNVVRLDARGTDDAIQWEDLPDGQVRLTVPIPPYSPANVARALGRMCVFVVGDIGARPTQHLIPWVRALESWLPLRMYRMHLIENDLPGVRLAVMQSSETLDGQRHMAVLRYGTAAYFLELPDRSWRQTEEISADRARNWIGVDRQAQLMTIAVNGEGKQNDIKESYTFSYESRELVDDPEHDDGS